MDLAEYQKMLLPMSSQWSWLPQSASTVAGDVDWLFYFLAWTCGGLFLLVVAPMIFFAFRYRRRQAGQRALSQKDHDLKLEIAWTALPVIYLAFLFHWGFVGYAQIYTSPGDAKQLRVMAEKWKWEVTYPTEDGGFKTKDLAPVIAVPINQPIELTMTSKDVLHSFFIPNFRVKHDVVPGRYTQLWFEATQLGDFPVFCTEYCGTGHSTMAAIIRVMPLEKYNEWLEVSKAEDAKTANLSPVERGKTLYQQNCKICHTIDGSALIGPSLKGVYGHKVELESGDTVVADDNYIRESILLPNAKLVKGFPNGGMTSFQGKFKEEEIIALIEFIKSLK